MSLPISINQSCSLTRATDQPLPPWEVLMRREMQVAKQLKGLRNYAIKHRDSKPKRKLNLAELFRLGAKLKRQTC